MVYFCTEYDKDNTPKKSHLLKLFKNAISLLTYNLYCN